MTRKYTNIQNTKSIMGKSITVRAFCMAAVLPVLTACSGENSSGSAGSPENAGAGNQVSFQAALIGSESAVSFGAALADLEPAANPGSALTDLRSGTDLSGGEENFERIMEEAELPQPYAEYLEILEQIRTEGRDPEGREYHSDQNCNFANNGFAILDVDNDGRQELIFNFNESYMGAMCEVVYEYDAETDTLHEELAEWVSTEYYHDGLVKVEMSHNHGKDPEGRGVWPYLVYRYDAEQDSYRLLYTVDGWDGQINGEGFPDELDTDGDKLLYCITAEDSKKLQSDGTLLLDRDEYESWEEELLPEWGRINVAYHPVTEESVDSVKSAYRQAAVYAAQADVWFMEDESRTSVGNYLLYDLDDDGSLELMVSVMEGTGRYSYNNFYGLTDQGKMMELELVRLCAGEERDWNADFDIGRTRVQAYQDRYGTIYYEGNDYVREGIYGGYDETGFYYLKDGVIYQDSIRRRTEFFGSGGEEKEIHYYGFATASERTCPEGSSDAQETKPEYEEEDEEITKEQYEAIREEYVKDMTGISVYQNWEYFTWDEITEGDITEEIICLRLFDSFLGSE